jgi:uncharacterized membrane protein YeaQ/YmgE (transglycosylase-associated protein family)
MNWISWVILGALVGWAGRRILPGKDPGGCFVTPLIGIAGALLGGFLATKLGFGGVLGFDWRSLITAVLGSVIVLFIWRLIKGKPTS